MATPTPLRPHPAQTLSAAETERRAQWSFAHEMLRAAQDGGAQALAAALATPEGATNAFSNSAHLHYAHSLLHEAIRNDQGECALILVPHSDLSAVNKEGQTPLLAALGNGMSDLAAAFAMLPGSDASVIDQAGNTALILAASLDHPEAAELVRQLLPLSEASRMNRYGMSALLAAARSGTAASLQFLAPKADAKARDPFGSTSFLLAANALAVERAQVLAPFSDLQETNDAGKNALALAAERHFAPMVEFLLPLVDWRQGAGQKNNVFDLAVADKSWDCADAIAFHAETHGQTVPGLRDIVSRAKKDLFPKSRALLEAHDIRQEMNAAQAGLSSVDAAHSGGSAVARRSSRAL